MSSLDIDFNSKDHSCVIVLGNGFDLDLGFKTSYKNFVGDNKDCDKSFFPFIKGGGDYFELGDYVRRATTIQKWYDLEDILAHYGSKVETYLDSSFVYGTEDEDRADFKKLIDGLKEYLSQVNYESPNPDSVAARLLKAMGECILPPTIYSFNYSDLSSIGESLGLVIDNPQYVHGSLKADDIILGVGDYAALRRSSDFLYKTNQDKYKSSTILSDLKECSCLIIFGLSMSRVDYPYFREFFSNVISGRMDRPYIRIITNDDSAKLEIKRNLREMNSELIGLYSHSDFDIIRTKDGVDENKVSQLIDFITNRWQIDL